MAYLGNIGTYRQAGRLVWSRYVIAQLQLEFIVGQYATYGGYVYVA